MSMMPGKPTKEKDEFPCPPLPEKCSACNGHKHFMDRWLSGKGPLSCEHCNGSGYAPCKALSDGASNVDLVASLKAESEGHQTVYAEDRRRKALFMDAANEIERLRMELASATSTTAFIHEAATLAESDERFPKIDTVLAALKAIREAQDGAVAITCQDCGRIKARSAEDAAIGRCPKWYAPRDAAAEADCKRFANSTADGAGGEDQ
jgi:hypothetical protein